MKNWIELCSDVSWEDYHGMWARKSKGGTWFVLVWTNMWDACGKEEGLDQYSCEVKSLDLTELSAENVASALRSCGFKATDEGIVSDQGDVISNKPHIMERILVETCIQHGYGAPLETFTGRVRPKNVRSKARRYAEDCMRDDALHAEALARPVNAIGSTAAEYGRGDVDSALHRGDSPTHQLMRKIHGIPEEPSTQFGTLQPDGTLTNVRQIRQSDLRRCSFSILMSEHYRSDGSCRCDDAAHRSMMIAEWEYSETDFANIPLRTA